MPLHSFASAALKITCFSSLCRLLAGAVQRGGEPLDGAPPRVQSAKLVELVVVVRANEQCVAASFPSASHVHTANLHTEWGH